MPYEKYREIAPERLEILPPPQRPRALTVTLRVPQGIANSIPRVLHVPAPLKYPERENVRINLKRSNFTAKGKRASSTLGSKSEPTVWKRVTVIDHPGVVHRGFATLHDDRLMIHGKSRTNRVLEREANRRRYSDAKVRGRHFRHIVSVRSDRHGLFALNRVKGRSNLQYLEHVAMVVRALR
jgi:hypothetical protein